MARPRKQTYPMETYLISNKDGDISNNADTQRKPAWKAIINGLIVTILTDDYIPPIILGEEENSQLNILDGGSRTAAFMMFRYGNWKISSSVEDSIIPYKKKNKDKDGNIVWEDATFNIKGKTYDQLPDELKKKFNSYQVETVIHENCDKGKISTYIKRYNEHSSMNTNQKAFTYIDRFADKIHRIVDGDFFRNNKAYSDNDRDKGVVERIVVETIMCMNHFDNWKTQAKAACKYLNENATKEEFEKFADNLHRLEDIISDDIRNVFNKKDSFIFLTLFDKFVKLGMSDEKFAEFLREFQENIRFAKRNDKNLLFDEIDKEASTKDKQVIADKLKMLEDLMNEFLGICKSNDNKEIINTETFIAKYVGVSLKDVEKDIDCYESTLDDLENNTIRDGSKLLDTDNRLSLLAMVAFSFKNEIDLDDWMTEYAKNNNTYFVDQKKNFLHMKQDFEQYLKRCA